MASDRLKVLPNVNVLLDAYGKIPKLYTEEMIADRQTNARSQVHCDLFSDLILEETK